MLTLETVSGSSLFIKDLLLLWSCSNLAFGYFSNDSLSLWKLTNLSVRSISTRCGILIPGISSLQSDLPSNAGVSLCFSTFLFLSVTVSQSFTLLCLLTTSSTPLRLCSLIDMGFSSLFTYNLQVVLKILVLITWRYNLWVTGG